MFLRVGSIYTAWLKQKASKVVSAAFAISRKKNMFLTLV